MTRPKTTPPTERFDRIDYLLSELLTAIDPEGESHMRAEIETKYRPLEAMENAMVDCLAMLSWRIHGCEVAETGQWSDVAPALPPDVSRDLQDPAIIAKISRYRLNLSGHADNCRRTLDRYAAFRKRLSTVTGAQLKKLKPCTSVIQ
ncbi:MAG: hypothetical protein ABSH50_02130 [Bryobacteraceae bacterium]|jgi:hypothetical protein